MSAEYSVDEVRAVADAIEFRGGPFSPVAVTMLRAYAERIEADERAVPAAVKPKVIATMMHADSRIYGVDFKCEGGAEIHIHGLPTTDVTAVNGCYLSSEKSAPTAEPPAQAAQVDALKCTAFLDGLALDASDADTLAYIRDRFSVPAKPSECTNGCPAQQVCDYCQPRSGKDAEPTAEPTHPHSPDAADSGRVTDKDVDAALFSETTDEYGEPTAMLIDFMGMGSTEKLGLARRSVRAALEAALAAQGQDWRIGMFDRWNEAAQEKGYAGICEAINSVPPASPVGVPDGWTRAEAKLHERKTVHEWLNELHIDREEFGKPLCLLRRLSILCDRYADTCEQLSFEIRKQAGWISAAVSQPERNAMVIYWHPSENGGFPAIADEWRDEHHLACASHWLPYADPSAKPEGGDVGL